MDDMFAKFWGYLVVIRPVLPQFVGAVILASAVIWGLINWTCSTRLASKDDQIALLVRQRDDARDSVQKVAIRNPIDAQDADKITKLMTDFERHAAEEATIVYQMRDSKYNYVRFDIVPQDQPNQQGRLTEQQYLDWLEFLKNFDKSCVELGLVATHGAISTAVTRFESRNINLIVAYMEYQRVSDSFKSEVARVGIKTAR